METDKISNWMDAGEAARHWLKLVIIFLSFDASHMLSAGSAAQPGKERDYRLRGLVSQNTGAEWNCCRLGARSVYTI